MYTVRYPLIRGVTIYCNSMKNRSIRQKHHTMHTSSALLMCWMVLPSGQHHCLMLWPSGGVTGGAWWPHVHRKFGVQCWKILYLRFSVHSICYAFWKMTQWLQIPDFDCMWKKDTCDPAVSSSWISCMRTFRLSSDFSQSGIIRNQPDHIILPDCLSVVLTCTNRVTIYRDSITPGKG